MLKQKNGYLYFRQTRRIKRTIVKNTTLLLVNITIVERRDSLKAVKDPCNTLAKKIFVTLDPLKLFSFPN